MFEITAIYAGIIGVIMAVLSTRVGILRGKYEVALGDGGQPGLALGIRHFGNLAEYAAMVIVLLALLEANGLDPAYLHALGISFVVLRILHPIALFATMDAPIWRKAARFLSAAGTALIMLIAGIALIFS